MIQRPRNGVTVDNSISRLSRGNGWQKPFRANAFTLHTRRSIYPSSVTTRRHPIFPTGIVLRSFNNEFHRILIFINKSFPKRILLPFGRFFAIFFYYLHSGEVFRTKKISYLTLEKMFKECVCMRRERDFVGVESDNPFVLCIRLLGILLKTFVILRIHTWAYFCGLNSNITVAIFCMLIYNTHYNKYKSMNI